MRRVLILCTGNSARSQMAEGWLKRLGQGRLIVESAGTHPSVVHPMAVAAMAERGIDLSAHRSKSVREFLGHSFDAVITVCDYAKESCPVFPGSPTRIHWSIPDPTAMGDTDAERLDGFRRVRDLLETRLREFTAAQG